MSLASAKMHNQLHKGLILRDYGLQENGYFVKAYNNYTEFFDTIRQFFRRYGIGTQINRKKWGDQKYRQIQTALYQSIDEETLSPRTTPAQLMQKLEKKVETNNTRITKYDFERVARTETAAMRAVYQLTIAKELGIVTVIHKTRNDPKVSKICKSKNNKPFGVQFLLNNAAYRIPIHPNCRCHYEIAR